MYRGYESKDAADVAGFNDFMARKSFFEAGEEARGNNRPRLRYVDLGKLEEAENKGIYDLEREGRHVVIHDEHPYRRSSHVVVMEDDTHVSDVPLPEDLYPELVKAYNTICDLNELLAELDNALEHLTRAGDVMRDSRKYAEKPTMNREHNRQVVTPEIRSVTAAADRVRDVLHKYGWRTDGEGTK